MAKLKKSRVILIFLLFIATGCALFLAWLYFYYPGATVYLEPKLENREQMVVMTGIPGQDIPEPDRGIIPLVVSEINVIDEQEIQAGGQKTVGVEPSRGRVRIINRGQEEHFLPAGTRLKTENNIQFKTTRDVTIPGLSSEYIMDIEVGTVAGQKEVEVRSVDQGQKTNVGKGEINRFVDSSAELEVINQQPTSGGENRQISVVQKKDIEKLSSRLKGSLDKGVERKIAREISDDYRVVIQQEEFSEPEFDFTASPGEEVETIKGTAQQEIKIYLIHNDHLEPLTDYQFVANLPDTYSMINNQINILEINVEQREADLYNVKVTAAGTVMPGLDFTEIADQLAGKEIEPARELLVSREEVAGFEISTRGEKMPYFSRAINLEIAEPRGYRVFQPD